MIMQMTVVRAAGFRHREGRGAGNTWCWCVVAIRGNTQCGGVSQGGRWVLVSARVPRRIATISVHTSPLEQPGTGDAGGLNVYVVEVAKRMAARGVEVDIFTRAVSRDAPPAAELVPGVLVRHLPAGRSRNSTRQTCPPSC